MSEEGSQKPRLFLQKRIEHKDEFVFVTHLAEAENAHLLHNAKTGKYQQKPCDCKVEEEVAV